MRDYNREFIGHVASELETQQQDYGSMSKVYYHRHYLAQEAANRLDIYREERKSNKARAIMMLVRAFGSIMGEYSKHVGYQGASDVNKDFICHVADECDRYQSLYGSTSKRSDLVDDTINKISAYTFWRNEEKVKADRYLIQAAAQLVGEYNRQMR